MSRLVTGFFVVAAFTMAGLIPAPAEPRLTFAQAGSTGGTIGKQDKSASGGEAPARARRAPRVRIRYVVVRERRAPRVRKHHFSEAAQGHAKAKGCPNIVGVWNSWASGLFGPADTTFFKNGTATHKSGIPGKWRCEGGELRMTWGGDPVARHPVSPDGKRIMLPDGSVSFSR